MYVVLTFLLGTELNMQEFEPHTHTAQAYAHTRNTHTLHFLYFVTFFTLFYFLYVYLFLLDMPFGLYRITHTPRTHTHAHTHTYTYVLRAHVHVCTCNIQWENVVDFNLANSSSITLSIL